MKNERKTIEFIRSKDFTFVKNIGQGGTGKTILIKDEIINDCFVCKKYSPFYEADREKYFNYFIDEIKILYKLNHRNIVRVFSYYLYPDQWTGYILMEYINGNKIYDYINNNPDRLDDIFTQVIDGFCNLEQNNILHRDIRPENILINETGIAKIIDFGFGKQIDFNSSHEKSLTLNWRYSTPNEFENNIYDIQTEIYFVGKLFEEIIKDRNLDSFSYLNVLQKMIKSDPDLRIKSFFDITRMIIANPSEGIDFSETEKRIYKNFANCFIKIITKIHHNAEYKSDIDDIIMGLDRIYKNSMLEDSVYNVSSIIKCFIKGEFYFRDSNEFSVLFIRDFIKILQNSSEDKRKVILNNLWQRIDSIHRYNDTVDDLPF